MSFPNVYTLRKVADTASKGCDVCHRPTSSVLLSQGTEAKDFFYVCPSHIRDWNFCSPIVDQAAIDAKKKKELDDELERVKKEYEEKEKAKKEKEKEKEKEKDKDKDKEDKDKNDKTEKKSPSQDKAETPTSPPTLDEPRVFALHRNFYSMRIEKRRQQEMAKRNRERMQNPRYFPSVPNADPGS